MSIAHCYPRLDMDEGLRKLLVDGTNLPPRLSKHGSPGQHRQELEMAGIETAASREACTLTTELHKLVPLVEV